MTIVVFCRASHFFYKTLGATPPNPWIHGHPWAKARARAPSRPWWWGWWALGSTSTLAWRFLGSTRQAEKHHGGLGVIKSKVSLRAGEGRKHDFFHAQNDGNDHVSTDWAAVLWARFLSLFDCQTAADSCEVGIGTIYVYIYMCTID